MTKEQMETALKRADQLFDEEAYREALSIYEKLADLNCLDSRFRLAFMLEHGLGVKQDTQQAIEHYTVAAKEGCVSSQQKIGIFDCFDDERAFNFNS